jgi:hypothetical protein
MGDDCGEDFHTVPLNNPSPNSDHYKPEQRTLTIVPVQHFPHWIGGEEPVHGPRPAGTERRPWRREKSILCGQGSLDMLVMKISGAPPRRARPTGIDRQGDEGIGVPELAYNMQGLVFLNRLARAHPPSSNLATSRAEVQPKPNNTAPKVSLNVSIAHQAHRSTDPSNR